MRLLPEPMAQRHIRATPTQVWAVLADGNRYADWVLGTHEIRFVDADWPARDTSIYYTVGWGPLTYGNRTTVSACVPDRVLELEVRAGLAGTVRVGIRLTPQRDGTLVMLEEHPLRGLVSWLHTPLGDVPLALRVHWMLRDLARLVEPPLASRPTQT